MDSHVHVHMPSDDLESAQVVVVSSHPVNTTTNVQDTSSSSSSCSSTHAATHVSEQHTLTPQAQPCGLLEPSQNTANNTASAYQRQQHSPPSSPTKEAELPGLVASTLDLLGDRVDETTLTPSMTEFLANPKVVAKLCEFVAQKRTETGELQDQSAAVTITRARRAAQLLSEPPRPIAQVVLRRAGPTAVTLCRLALPVEQNHGGDAANRCTAPAANAVGALLRRAPRQVVRGLDEAGLVPQLLASVDVAPWADGLLRAFEAMLSTLASVITQQRRAATAAAGGGAKERRLKAKKKKRPMDPAHLDARRRLADPDSWFVPGADEPQSGMGVARHAPAPAPPPLLPPSGVGGSRPRPLAPYLRQSAALAAQPEELRRVEDSVPLDDILPAMQGFDLEIDADAVGGEPLSSPPPRDLEAFPAGGQAGGSIDDALGQHWQMSTNHDESPPPAEEVSPYMMRDNALFDDDELEMTREEGEEESNNEDSGASTSAPPPPPFPWMQQEEEEEE